MIPASRRRAEKNRLQQARQRRGLDWEKALAADLNEEGLARCWPAGWGGQPWDISAVLEGYAYAIECKHIARGNLGYSAFTANEIETAHGRCRTHDDDTGRRVPAGRCAA